MLTLSKTSLRIETVFDCDPDHPSAHQNAHYVRSILQRLLPNDLLFNEGDLGSFYEQLPIIKWFEWGEEKNISLFLLCRYRPGVGKFFHDIISRWLVPGKYLRVGLSFATDFKLPDWDDELYFLAKMVICTDYPGEIEMIRANLPIIESEIRLGVSSVYHASRILEIKGLSADEKTALIQERISALVQRRSQEFDYDIFSQMQHFLVMCQSEFKAVHEYEHMTRIIYVFYLFRKALRALVEAAPDKRHLRFKVSKTRLHLPLGPKRVLGLFVGMNFLQENEVFEERHLMKAVKLSIPEAVAVPDSFFEKQNREDKIHTMYLEIEKEGDFTLAEIARLRRELPDALKTCVEQLVRPVFMPRNEEEVMRNIVTLSQQLKYVKDIPQVIISFDEQMQAELCFTVILLRIVHPETVSVQELFQRTKTRLCFLPDRVKRVGMVRNKHPKEATVFRVKMSNSSFLRGDHSVDLYKARQAVVVELQRILGEFRDFNGGMISKQVEVFLMLKKILGPLVHQQEMLLENFFHSIYPVELRSVVDPVPLKILFLMLLEAVEEGKGVRHLSEANRIFVLTALPDNECVTQAIEGMGIRSPHLLTVQLNIHEIDYLGYIYFSDDKMKQELFLETIVSSTLTFES